METCAQRVPRVTPAVRCACSRQDHRRIGQPAAADDLGWSRPVPVRLPYDRIRGRHWTLSISPLFWLMSAEVFPNRLRGAGASACTVANGSANLLVTVTFLSLISAIGKSWTFWLYGIMAGVAIVFVAMRVPETKGHPLEDIDSYWREGRRWPGELREPSAG
ncbi:MAG: MFS transporter [Solirubrobacteraceae bacterium]